jgi:hypothetical protein
MRPDSDLDVLNQSDEMPNRKDCEEDARYAQSGSLRVHGANLVITF